LGRCGSGISPGGGCWPIAGLTKAKITIELKRRENFRMVSDFLLYPGHPLKSTPRLKVPKKRQSPEEAVFLFARAMSAFGPKQT
jgi:hypothetical protein